MSGSTAYSRFVVTKNELRSRFADALAETTEDDPTVFTDNAMQLAQDIEECNNIYRQADTQSGAIILSLEPTDNTDYCDVGSINITTADSGNQLAALTFAVYYSDIFNNPMPAGTSVSVTADNGEYSAPAAMPISSATL